MEWGFIRVRFLESAPYRRSAATRWRSSPARSSSTVSASASARASASRSRRPRPSRAAAREPSCASAYQAPGNRGSRPCTPALAIDSGLPIQPSNGPEHTCVVDHNIGCYCFLQPSWRSGVRRCPQTPSKGCLIPLQGDAPEPLARAAAPPQRMRPPPPARPYGPGAVLRSPPRPWRARPPLPQPVHIAQHQLLLITYVYSCEPELLRHAQPQALERMQLSLAL